jgi:hypothetical protein
MPDSSELSRAGYVLLKLSWHPSGKWISSRQSSGPERTGSAAVGVEVIFLPHKRRNERDLNVRIAQAPMRIEFKLPLNTAMCR